MTRHTPAPRFAFVVPLLLCAAAGTGPPPPAAAAPGGAGMDYGPFLSCSLDRDRAVSLRHTEMSTEQDGAPNALATKAVVVRLGGSAGGTAVAFDTDLLRYAAGWTGGFLNLEQTHLTSQKGAAPPTPAGDLAFAAPRLAGWSADGPLKDPRPKPFGPLPKSAGHYKGLYRHGERVVFKYSVGGTEVLDMPGAAEVGGRVAFTRTLHVARADRPLRVLACGFPGSAPQVRTDGAVLTAKPSGAKGRALTATVISDPPTDTGWDPDAADGAVLVLPPHQQPRRVKVILYFGTNSADVGLPDALKTAAAGPPEDLAALTRGGPPLWPQEMSTRGRVAADDRAYVVDSLALPADNPWKAWVRPTGFDFFPDGRIALCTWNGDVWVVSGVDDTLQNLKWRRYAAGLYEPLGLKIVNDVVYTTGRDQITKLHDLNDDGEADFYENFNNDAAVTSNYHGFAFDLHTDAAGNFYYLKAGHRADPKLPHHGVLLRVSPDGSALGPVAAGFRAANGMCVGGPGGLITAADNQGNWTPTSRINVVRPGGFYGYMPHVTAAGGPKRDDYDPPLCWIPIDLDNSSGSQVWAGERWGPLSGRLLHTSYGKASLMLVTTQQSGDVWQGGVIPLPLRFDSGVMRGRVSPKDGQLYLCGLRGWQTAGAQDGALARVRYTGKPLYLPLDARVVKGGIELTFSQKLDRETAEDFESYGIEQWNYRWGAAYGSKDWRASDPEQQGRDEVEVAAVKLLPDGKTVRLEVPDLKPVMQMVIRVNVDAEDGMTISDAVYLTVNRVPGS